MASSNSSLALTNAWSLSAVSFSAFSSSSLSSKRRDCWDSRSFCRPWMFFSRLALSFLRVDFSFSTDARDRFRAAICSSKSALVGLLFWVAVSVFSARAAGCFVFVALPDVAFKVALRSVVDLVDLAVVALAVAGLEVLAVA